MDIIYADRNKFELGTIKNSVLDIAYGNDENDFECIVDKSKHCCKEHYYLYINDTEYGGIIDKIGTNSNNEVIYSGRTWHGILDGKIICPDQGNDFYVVKGEANKVIGLIIKKLGLSNLFTSSSEDSGIQISYQFPRYVKGYQGIINMLRSASAKLKIVTKNQMVELSAELLVDYSQNDEFNTKQMVFDITKDYRPVNHLICLGSGELSNRKVIHLFVDENGGLQRYLKTEVPFSDDDYVLDTSMQKLFDEDEYAKTFEYSNAAVTENYLILKEKPNDWEKNIDSYYQKESDKFNPLSSWEVDIYTVQLVKPYDWTSNYKNYFELDGGEYKNAKSISEDVYSLQKSQPSDWNSDFGKYFMLVDGDYLNIYSVNDELFILQSDIPSDWSTNYKNYFYKDNNIYKEVQTADIPEYTVLAVQPKDWEKNYKDYYYYWSDGASIEYRSVQGDSVEVYEKQTTIPTNWETNYSDYFYYLIVYRYRYRCSIMNPLTGSIDSIFYEDFPTMRGEKWISGNIMFEYVETISKPIGYTKIESFQNWEPDKFYTKKTKKVAPAFIENMYYSKKVFQGAPEWEQGMYYTKNTQAVPTWNSNSYYTKSVNNVPTWTYGKYYTASKKTEYPKFVNSKYYEKRIDNFADLVESGINRLKELRNTDNLSIKLSPMYKYDINDIVGASDDVTNVKVNKYVTKKIVKIQDGLETINYEIGE